MKARNYTLFDNNYDFEEEKNLYIEMLDDAHDVTDNEIYEHISFIEQLEWETLKDTLTEMNPNGKWIVMGNVGHWSGSHKGGNVFDGTDCLFNAIADSGERIKVYFEDDHLYFNAADHDGSSCMEIKALTDKGYNVYDNWNYSYHSTIEDKSEYQVLEGLWGCNIYSKIPR